jgi:hypothetical protein
MSLHPWPTAGVSRGAFTCGGLKALWSAGRGVMGCACFLATVRLEAGRVELAGCCETGSQPLFDDTHSFTCRATAQVHAQHCREFHVFTLTTGGYQACLAGDDSQDTAELVPKMQAWMNKTVSLCAE